jgi:exonuclease III
LAENKGKTIVNALESEYYYRRPCDEQLTGRDVSVFLAVKKDLVHSEDYINWHEREHEYGGFCGRNWLGATLNNIKRNGFKNNQFTILGVHVPNNKKYCDMPCTSNCEWKRNSTVEKKNEDYCNRNKQIFWDGLQCCGIHGFAECKKCDDAIIVGDFNGYLSFDDIKPKEDETPQTIKNEKFYENVLDDNLAKLSKSWVDLWHETTDEGNTRYTWRKKREFRLDYAFSSPTLAKRFVLGDSIKAVHDSTVRVGDNRLSDHSMLIVEIKLSVINPNQ